MKAVHYYDFIKALKYVERTFPAHLVTIDSYFFINWKLEKKSYEMMVRKWTKEEKLCPFIIGLKLSSRTSEYNFFKCLPSIDVKIPLKKYRGPYHTHGIENLNLVSF